MDSYDCYDTYKINEKNYVRFNNIAFVSNYKRNDILTTMMTLYCIPVGKFKKERYDFLKEISKKETLLSTAGQSQTLADVYPSNISFVKETNAVSDESSDEDIIKLYDVLYACVSAEDKNE